MKITLEALEPELKKKSEETAALMSNLFVEQANVEKVLNNVDHVICSLCQSME